MKRFTFRFLAILLSFNIIFSSFYQTVTYAQDFLDPGEGGGAVEPTPDTTPDAQPQEQPPEPPPSYFDYTPPAETQPADVPQEPAPQSEPTPAPESPPAVTPIQTPVAEQPEAPSPAPVPTLTPTLPPPQASEIAEEQRSLAASPLSVLTIYGEIRVHECVRKECDTRNFSPGHFVCIELWHNETHDSRYERAGYDTGEQCAEGQTSPPPPIEPTPVPTPQPHEPLLLHARELAKQYAEDARSNPAVDQAAQANLLQTYEEAAGGISQRNDAQIAEARSKADEQTQGASHTIASAGDAAQNAPSALIEATLSGAGTSLGVVQGVAESAQQFQQAQEQDTLAKTINLVEEEGERRQEEERKEIEEVLLAPLTQRAAPLLAALNLSPTTPSEEVIKQFNEKVAVQTGLHIEGAQDVLTLTQQPLPLLAETKVESLEKFEDLPPSKRKELLDKAQGSLLSVVDFAGSTIPLYDYAKHSGQRSMENKKALDQLIKQAQEVGFSPPIGLINVEQEQEIMRLQRLSQEQLEEEAKKLRQSDPLEGEQHAQQLLKQKAYADTLAQYDREQMQRIDDDMKDLAINAALIMVGGKALEVGGKVLNPVARQVSEKSQGLIGAAKNFIAPVLKKEAQEGVLLAENALRNVATETLATEAKQVLKAKGLKETQALIEERLRKEIAQKAPDTLLTASKVELDDTIHRETAKLLDMDVFYHYTSEAGAKGIPESGIIRASKGSLTYKGVFVTDLRPDQIQPTRGKSGNAPTSILDAGMQLGNRLGITQQVGVKAERLTDYFVIYAPKGTFKPTLENRVGVIREWITNNQDILLDDPRFVVTTPQRNTSLREAPSIMTSVALSTGTVGIEAGAIGGFGAGALSLVPKSQSPTREEITKAVSEVNASLPSLVETSVPLESRLPWSFIKHTYAQGVNKDANLTISADFYEALIKRRIVKNKLAKEGKVSAGYVKNALALDLVAPQFAKTEKGYIFITGKGGTAEGEIEAGSYIVKIDPISQVDLTVPTKIEAVANSPITVPVAVRAGVGNVKRVDSINEKSQTTGTTKVTLVLFKDRNENSKLDREEEPLPLAGVRVELTKIDQDQSIPLLPGWNLVTLTALPGKPITASVLLTEIARQGGYATTVATLENSAWKTFVVRGDKSFSGEDFPITPGKAYFLKSLKRSLLLFKGQEFAAPVKLSLNSGWNAVGLPKTSQTYNASKLIDALNIKEGNADAASRWESGLWDTFVKKAVEQYGENFPIETNRGYIVRVGKEVEFSP